MVLRLRKTIEQVYYYTMNNKKHFSAPKNSKSTERPTNANEVVSTHKFTSETTGYLMVTLQGRLKTPWYKSPDGKSHYHKCVKHIPISHEVLVEWAQDDAKPKGWNGNWKTLSKNNRRQVQAQLLAEYYGGHKFNLVYID